MQQKRNTKRTDRPAADYVRACTNGRTPEDLAERLGLPLPRVLRSARILAGFGILELVDGKYHVKDGAFK